MTRKPNRTPITYVQLATPELASEPLLAEKSWMLSGVSSHYDLRGYFVLTHGLTKDASLGVLFSDVPTPEDGRFQLELGVILPDLFPNYAENSEYCLSIKTEAGQREVCLSNVMARPMMYAAFQQFAPESDVGIDLSVEYRVAIR